MDDASTTSTRKRNAFLFLVLPSSRFTRGLCLCLCLCLRRTCKPALTLVLLPDVSAREWAWESSFSWSMQRVWCPTTGEDWGGRIGSESNVPPPVKVSRVWEAGAGGTKIGRARGGLAQKDLGERLWDWGGRRRDLGRLTGVSACCADRGRFRQI